MTGGLPSQIGEVKAISSTPDGSSTTPGGPTTIISKLFRGTIEFWLLILGEQSWPFSFDPAPLEITKSEDNAGQNYTAIAKHNFWDNVRHRLLEERDQMCLWKVGFTDQDLDDLLESEVNIHRQLGKVILDALLRLAFSMRASIGMI